MRTLPILWILATLTASVFIVVRFISKPVSRALARGLRTSRKKTERILNYVFPAILLLLIGVSVQQLNLNFTVVISSGIFFLTATAAKLFMESSAVYVLYPAGKSEKLDSILLFLIFFAVFILVLSLLYFF